MSRFAQIALIAPIGETKFTISCADFCIWNFPLIGLLTAPINAKWKCALKRPMMKAKNVNSVLKIIHTIENIQLSLFYLAELSTES
jgi:hypothetical protein